MTTRFAAERAISPTDGSCSFVVVDDAFALHREACEYLASLRFRDRSVNTERAYAGRLALFLTYCADNRLDWRSVTMQDLAGFQCWLVTEPIQQRSTNSVALNRSNKTANAFLTSVCEFLRFAATQGWFPPELAQQISERKYLRRGPTGFDFGENDQFRTVRSRALRLAEIDNPPQCLTADEIVSVLRALPRLRDRLLVAILAESGVRIGEALGLRREDMHLLASNKVLGCAIPGPHIHVRRRANPNGSLAKSRFPRSIPVTPDVVEFYADYQFERSQVPGGDTSDFVFVNLYKPPLGDPLRYHNAKKLFERLSQTVGFDVSPHMFRHSAATRWLETGTPRDVVQALLGHVSPASMSVYFHPTNESLRAAVERGSLTPSSWSSA
ncbi:integrase [Mycobacterium paragordonae]|uniref:tyrosine-type recombinase/integrase n=1 Tax=Mycobacterium paragordonae TaxID=1389713 RepID=UPI00105BAF92|nr:tyrosine-type recombinase/integrase [Mycobacterium paragordonae]TDK88349.1 integrase [Mycobacterium paragordonae]